MSENIETVDGSIFLSSVDGGNYDLLVIEKEGKKEIIMKSYSYAEYRNLIKKLWGSYLEEGKKPEIVGQVLTDKGFVIETLHSIAPALFWDPAYGPLDKFREDFIIWLKYNIRCIKEKIGEEETRRLEGSLEMILKEHLEKKLEDLKRKRQHD